MRTARPGVWSRGVEPDAVFEIGSITKTFTATVLASMVRDGLVALDDPVARHLPVAPPVNGRPITLEDLATHRSGLPRLPAGMLVQGYTTQRKNPYASLDDARMRRAIAETKPKRAPGGKVAYSNYGYGLLGYALAQRAGTSYAELRARAHHRPLGLTHTALDTPGLTQGHGFFGRAAHVLGPRVARRRGRAALDRPRHARLPRHPQHRTARWPQAARDTRVRRGEHGQARRRPGLDHPARRHRPKWAGFEHETLMHDGGTGGFRSFASVVPETGKAVVVLGSRARSVTGLGIEAHASAVSRSASTRSSAATSSGGANR